MKKYILLILVIASLLLTTCAFSLMASAANIVIQKAGIDESTNKVVVSGKVESGMTNTVLTLLILRPGANENDIQASDILQGNQLLLSEIDAQNNIVFSFPAFSMPVTAKSGEYKVLVAGDNAYNMYKETASFSYVGVDKVYEGLLAIDKADINSISNVIDSNADYLMIDKKAYFDLTATTKTVINPLLTSLEISVEACSDYETNPQSLSTLLQKLVNFRKDYKKIISIGQLRDASTALGVKNWMDIYTNKYTYGQNEYDIDYDFDGQKDVVAAAPIPAKLSERSLIYSLFNQNMTRDEQKKTLEELAGNDGLKSINEIREAFYTSIFLKGIEFLPWAKTKDILESFPNRFNLNYTDFNKLNDTNKDKVYQSLSGNTFATINNVKEAFERSANLELQKQNETQTSISGNSGNSGNSGRSGSSISFTPSNKTEDNNSDLTDADNGNQNGVAKSNFNDISDVQWAYEAINELSKKGIINGKEQGRFAPNDHITRAEFIKILIGAFNLVDENAKTDLLDVNEGDWHYKYVASAQKYGVTVGRNNGTFGVNDVISRQDMVVLMNRLAKTVGIIFNASESKAEFSDFGSIDSYAQTAIKEFVDAGIVNGMTNNTFAPKDTATRAQAAKLIYSLVQLIK